MLETLKLLLNTSNETLLAAIIDIVEAEFMDYCNRDDIPTAANGVLINMARIQYARLDSQGLASQSISGVSEGYEGAFYPTNVLEQMNKYRKLKSL